MADNVTVDNGTGTDYGVASDKITYSGDADQAVQLVKLVTVSGSEGSKTATDVATGVQYVEDSAITANLGQGTLVVGRRDDALTALTPAENDAVGLRVAANGALWTAVADPATGTALFVDATTGGTIAHVTTDDGPVEAAASTSDADTGAGSLSVAPTLFNGSGYDRLRGNTNGVFVNGSVAHDATDAGNPVKIGGKANAAAPTDVTANNERVDAWFLRNGAQATALTAAGALVGGDATNGLDVDVTRLPALVAGTANIGDVDVLTMPNVTLAAGTNTNEVVGDVASDVAIAGNPVTIGARASTVIPTAVAADGRAVNVWANRNGAVVPVAAPHVGLNSDPWNLVHEGVRYTSAQTSAVVVAGGASEKLVVTKVQLQTEGTTAGTAILYFGTGAFARGTNRACFDGNFIPSATNAPGVVMDGPFIAGTNGDDLLFTSVGAITIIVNVWYYVVT